MSTETLIPRALRNGDTIAFISPSTRPDTISPAPLERAKAYLEFLSYHVKIIYSDISALTHKESVLARCEELHSAFRDPTIKAIICTSGGDSSNELIRHLNYELISANPKIFSGYSDITVLHYAFFTQAKLRTFYGPFAIKELGDQPQPLKFTAQHFLSMLTKDGLDAGQTIGPVPRSLEWAPDFGPPTSAQPRQMAPSPGWKWLRPGKATGQILGGCLSSILHLAGTKFWPDYTDKILLLESYMGAQTDKPLPLIVMRSQMADLGNLGVFDVIAGLVIGRPSRIGEEGRKEYAEIVMGQLDVAGTGRDFPVLMNVDVGHTGPILTVPLGVLCSLDSERGEWKILEAGVRD
jgi:muramoyltetrapeptide carboxypeptidase